MTQHEPFFLIIVWLEKYILPKWIEWFILLQFENLLLLTAIFKAWFIMGFHNNFIIGPTHLHWYCLTSSFDVKEISGYLDVKD